MRIRECVLDEVKLSSHKSPLIEVEDLLKITRVIILGEVEGWDMLYLTGLAQKAKI